MDLNKLSNLPVIGCAKRSLLPIQGILAEKRSSCLEVLHTQLNFVLFI
jgi:hypothetical protein